MYAWRRGSLHLACSSRLEPGTSRPQDTMYDVDKHITFSIKGCLCDQPNPGHRRLTLRRTSCFFVRTSRVEASSTQPASYQVAPRPLTSGPRHPSPLQQQPSATPPGRRLPRSSSSHPPRCRSRCHFHFHSPNQSSSPPSSASPAPSWTGPPHWPTPRQTQTRRPPLSSASSSSQHRCRFPHHPPPKTTTKPPPQP